MSATAFDRFLTLILLFAVPTIAVGAAHNFRLVSIEQIYDFRDKMASPAILSYLTVMNYSTLLPFAFAGFVERKAYWRSGAVLVLLLFFYPITLTKLALFAPIWLVAMLLLSRLVETRIAVVLSLLVRVLAGVLLVILFRAHATSYFSMVNFRMLVVPSNGIDVYNDYFSSHDLTYFCQISILKPMMNCPLSGAIIRGGGKYLQTRQFQRVTAVDRRRRFGGTIVRADFSVRVRARIRARQPPVCGSDTTLLS